MDNINLYQRIQFVTSTIKNVEKGSQVGEGKNSYKAVSDSDVIKAVRKAEAENGILSIAIKQDLISEGQLEVSGKYGDKLYHHHTVKMTTRIINIEKPSEFIDVESLGYGWDTGDKGLGKASTYARKYALLNAYKILTGEDPDKDINEDLSKTKEPAKQFSFKDEMHKKDILSKIEVIAEERGKTKAICEACKIDKITDMTDKQIKYYQEVYKIKED